jgi:hypothetical protein
VANGKDLGACAKNEPCRTLSYGIAQVTLARGVIRVTGGEIRPTVPVNPGMKQVYIDGIGANLVFQGAAGTPGVGVTNSGRLTIEGLSFPGSESVSVSDGGSLRLSRVKVETGTTDFAKASFGSLQIVKSAVNRLVSCTNRGTITVVGSSVRGAGVQSNGCDFLFMRNRLVGVSDSIAAYGGGRATIINNVMSTSNPLDDLLYLQGVGPGSRFQFNTVLNLSGVASDGVALKCDAATDVTDNIFSYGSAHPLSAECQTRYNLYDTVVAFVPGEGNVRSDATGFFVDLSREDYRPSPSSPARGIADPFATEHEDFNGGIRPLPAGSRADVGAFEVP